MTSVLVTLLIVAPAICWGASVEPIASEAIIELAPIKQETVQKPAEDVHARQSSGNRPFGGLLQPLNPQNFLNNLIPGRSTERKSMTFIFRKIHK
jgi:hypothetical protein